MSTTTQQIENIVSIVQENATIAEQNANMANAVNLISMSNEELMLGKQKIVDAINKMGGSASIDDTLSGLAKALRKLGMLDPEIGLTDDVPKPINLGDWLAGGYGKYLKTAKSDEVTSIAESAFNDSPITVVDFPNATSVDKNAFRYCKISKLNLPNVTTITQHSLNATFSCDVILPKIKVIDADYAFGSSPKLILPELTSLKSIATHLKNIKEIFIGGELTSCGYANFTGDVEVIDARKCSSPLGGLQYSISKKLIDIVIGENIKGNFDFVSYHNPTTAYSKTSASLCYDTDLERYGQRFSRNWDKWKWCIINHMAANFEDRTGLDAFTITFGNTVLSQFDEEMIEAFTSKNWTLA